MIIRIVKMTFQEKHVQDFLDMFYEKRHDIAAMKGCLHLELWNDKNQANIYFTYSHWETELDLNNYRDSALFAKVWPQTKQWFAAKAEAWTVERL
jgi:(4S)-4-hydroxy-5-phosphonooxypentane-2,3-dione isomerase